MQKKTRSRLSEVLFISVCICCSLFSIYQFYQALNRTLVKDEEPIGTISFKYKTAQRKFIDDTLWDRLQQDSPVYEGDTIRTAEQSEATLTFIDGNMMELQSNTMIRINLSDDGGAEVDFTSGSISVHTGETSSMKIRSGSSVVDIAANASVAAAGGTDDNSALKVAVKDGNASYISESGTINLEAGKVTEISTEGTIEEHFLSVNYPEDNYRVISFKTPSCSVPFSWESAGRGVILEFSDSKNFDNITATSTFNDVTAADVTLSEGSHWWRMTTIPFSADEQPERVYGKLTVLYSPVPTPISPRKDNVTYYRTKLPQIRLSWSESERATAYRLDIADNPGMKDPVFTQRYTTTSSIVSSLAEGTWYWTITPYYTLNNIGYAETSAVSSFNIVRSGELNAPVLQYPETDGVICTQVPLSNGDISYKSVLFSWKNDPEAQNYDIALWSGNSSTPFLQKTVSSNYCSLDTSKNAIPKGNVYWQVTIRDSEGNTKSSEKRAFYAIDSDIEQKALFPPEDYRVVTTRSSELEFSWKTNIPFTTTLQISKTEDFSNIIYTAETTDTSAIGRNLSAGEYWWRVSTKAGSSIISTPARQLVVEDLMERPALLGPADKGLIVPQAESSTGLSWSTVEGADYYQVKMYNTAKPDTLIIDKNFLESSNGTSCYLSLDALELPEGNYTWTVQGFRNETTEASRSSSYLATYSFGIKELHPITLSGPQNQTVFDGISAWTKPSRFTWQTGDTPKKWTLTVYKNSVSSRNIVKTYNNPVSGILMPQLEEGTYWWTITGYTEEGYDISVQEPRSFTVSRIPALPAPEIIEPEIDEVFGVAYLQNNHTITFAWEPVTNATEYILTVKNASGVSLEIPVLSADTTEYVLEDLTSLENGPVIWTLQANRIFEGKLLQSGEISTQSFEIDLPPLTIPQIKDFGTRYGM